ncbi:hypothetical protein IWQ60_004933 [Tieghemiomyces parasiticus]|uniref:CAP-Gly domain-containing protein n=1 Tax=Tieghemiomyces parasiticus TaxID=78921 RepID=A0A9W8A791_9FUNG|nr:hypothetical protein IWQ60_004933 [Tieghemiomyces parasiticus]
MPGHPHPSADPVGRRFEYQGATGTVRFRGPVVGAPGEWYGVEWDDTSRGKHDGSKGGVRYFTARAPTAGSFLRVAVPLNWGSEFLEAVVRKYLVTADRRIAHHAPETLLQIGRVAELVARYRMELAASKDQATDGSTVPPHSSLPLVLGDTTIPLEAVGWDQAEFKFSQVDKLKMISLAHQGIVSAGDATAIAEVCTDTEELDLSNNLFTDWTEIMTIARALPRLRVLRLNGNRFDPALIMRPDAGPVDHIRTLTLNRTGLTWAAVADIVRHTQGLEELSVAFNGMDHLELETVGPSSVDDDLRTHLGTLRHLSLEGNALTNWANVAPLGSLPSLASLSLARNRLTGVARPTTEAPFARLAVLNIDGNCIDQLAAAGDALDLFPSLHSLRFKNNPAFTEYSADRIRLELVCRVGRLDTVNGSPLNPRERTDLERYYLKQIGETLPTQDEEAIVQLHPRYRALVALHGAPVTRAPTTTGRALGGRLLDITVRTGDPAEADDGGGLRRQVLPTMTVGNLLARSARLLELTSPARLYLVSPSQPVS